MALEKDVPEESLRYRVFISAIHALMEQVWLRVDAEYRRINAEDKDVIATRNMMRAVAATVDSDFQADQNEEREDQSRGSGRKLALPF